MSNYPMEFTLCLAQGRSFDPMNWIIVLVVYFIFCLHLDVIHENYLFSSSSKNDIYCEEIENECFLLLLKEITFSLNRILFHKLLIGESVWMGLASTGWGFCLVVKFG